MDNLIWAALGGAAAGALATGLLVWLVSARTLANVTGRLREDLAAAQARVGEAARRAQQADLELRSVREENAALREAAARVEAEARTSREATDEKLRLVHEGQQQLRETFQALAADALGSSRESFLALAGAQFSDFQTRASGDLERRQQAFDELLKPMFQALDHVNSRLAEVERDRLQTTAALGEQLRALGSGLVSLQSETGNLVRALRQPHTRGHWGEIQLRRVVELAGMVNYCDFFEQQTAGNGDHRSRPDLIVRLPGSKNIIVDAKTPLVAYLDAVEAGEEARAARLAEHARQVRDHVTKLSRKEYWASFEPTPELVVMFLPIETALAAALQHDPELLEYAGESRILLASPTTLIAVLRAVAYGWRQELVAQNAREVSALGHELYGRLAIVGSNFEELRKGLKTAVESFNKAVWNVETRVLVSARRFKELGAAPSQAIAELRTVDVEPRSPSAPELLLLGGEDEGLEQIDGDRSRF